MIFFIIWMVIRNSCWVSPVSYKWKNSAIKNLIRVFAPLQWLKVGKNPLILTFDFSLWGKQCDFPKLHFFQILGTGSVIRCLHYFFNGFFHKNFWNGKHELHFNNKNYLGIPSDLPELRLTGNVFGVMFGLGVAIGVKIGLNAGSPPPMASVEYLIFVYSRVLFWKKKKRECIMKTSCWLINVLLQIRSIQKDIT